MTNTQEDEKLKNYFDMISHLTLNDCINIVDFFLRAVSGTKAIQTRSQLILSLKDKIKENLKIEVYEQKSKEEFKKEVLSKLKVAFEEQQKDKLGYIC